jgi:hypothetical protein
MRPQSRRLYYRMFLEWRLLLRGNLRAVGDDRILGRSFGDGEHQNGSADERQNGQNAAYEDEFVLAEAVKTIVALKTEHGGQGVKEHHHGDCKGKDV